MPGERRRHVAAAVDRGDLERVGQPVERQRARQADDVAAVDDPPPEAAVLFRMLVEVHLGGVLVEPGRRHVLGFLDGHPVHMVDLLADLVVLPQMGAAGERGVVILDMEGIGDRQLAHRHRLGQIGNDGLGRRRVRILLAHHHPADVVEYRLATLIDADRAHVDDAGLAVLVLPEPDYRRGGGKGVAGKYRLAELAGGIAEVGDGVERDVGNRLAEDHVKGEHVVDRRPLQAQGRGGKLGRGVHREARAVERRIQRHVAVGDRPGRRVNDPLAHREVFEVVSGIGFYTHDPIRNCCVAPDGDGRVR